MVGLLLIREPKKKKKINLYSHLCEVYYLEPLVTMDYIAHLISLKTLKRQKNIYLGVRDSLLGIVL